MEFTIQKSAQSAFESKIGLGVNLNVIDAWDFIFNRILNCGDVYIGAISDFH